jgi:hypothetical protein
MILQAKPKVYNSVGDVLDECRSRLDVLVDALCSEAQLCDSSRTGMILTIGDVDMLLDVVREALGE